MARRGRRRRAGTLLVLAVSAALLLPAPTAQAGLIRGVATMVIGVLEIPRSTLAGTFSGPPIIGTLSGVVKGTLKGAILVTRGALETAFSVVGLATKYAPLIPIFL